MGIINPVLSKGHWKNRVADCLVLVTQQTVKSEAWGWRSLRNPQSNFLLQDKFSLTSAFMLIPVYPDTVLNLELIKTCEHFCWLQAPRHLWLSLVHFCSVLWCKWLLLVQSVTFYVKKHIILQRLGSCMAVSLESPIHSVFFSLLWFLCRVFLLSPFAMINIPFEDTGIGITSESPSCDLKW